MTTLSPLAQALLDAEVELRERFAAAGLDLSAYGVTKSPWPEPDPPDPPEAPPEPPTAPLSAPEPCRWLAAGHRAEIAWEGPLRVAEGQRKAYDRVLRELERRGWANRPADEAIRADVERVLAGRRIARVSSRKVSGALRDVLTPWWAGFDAPWVIRQVARGRW